MYFPQWLYRFTFPLAMCKCSYFSTSLPILVLICLFHFSHPNGYEVVSHCSFDLYSLMANYVGPLLHVYWLFVYLLWRNAYSNILFTWKLIFVFLLLICKSSLYILDTSPLLDMLVANISPILLVVFSLSRLYHLQKVLILRKSKLFIFSFIDCVFGIVFKKVLPNPRTRRFIPIFL